MMVQQSPGTRYEARDAEAALLDRCAAAGRDDVATASDGVEANVFRLAAMVLGRHRAVEARRLLRASDAYFKVHPGERLAPADAVRRGWVVSLPRLRTMLEQRWQT